MSRRVVAIGALLAAAAVTAPAHAEDPRADKRSFYELIDEDDPNPANYEFSFLSMGLTQNFGITHWKGGGFYFGAGGGVGTPLYRIAKMEDRDIGIDGMLEAVYGNVYFRVAPMKYLDVDVGARAALGATTFDISDAPRGGFVRGAYVDLRVGSKDIKFGPRFEYDSIVYSDYTETGWKITPLLLRIVK